MKNLKLSLKNWKKLNISEMNSIKGKGWGNNSENMVDRKNCPPPYEPGGKQNDKKKKK